LQQTRGPPAANSPWPAKLRNRRSFSFDTTFLAAAKRYFIFLVLWWEHNLSIVARQILSTLRAI
jgi:hypothetical protein